MSALLLKLANEQVGERREAMKAYSQDLRECVLRTVDLGRPRAEIGQLFGVSLATIKRYIKQRREQGHVRPKAIPGRLPKKRAQVEAGVLPQFPRDAQRAMTCSKQR